MLGSGLAGSVDLAGHIEDGLYIALLQIETILGSMTDHEKGVGYSQKSLEVLDC